jgi:hypothetical protein
MIKVVVGYKDLNKTLIKRHIIYMCQNLYDLFQDVQKHCAYQSVKIASVAINDYKMSEVDIEIFNNIIITSFLHIMF